MATVRNLITAAARQINIIDITEVPDTPVVNVMLEELDSMLDSWSNDPLMIFTRNPYQFNTVPNQRDYTLGPDGDWDVPRPMEIDQAYVNWNANTPQQTDIPVTILTDSQYAAISVKNTSTNFAFALYDNGNYPLRTISLWPVPTTDTPITLWLMQPLIDFDNINEEVSFPPGYYDAFKYNLAVRCAGLFGKDPSAALLQYAVSSKAQIARLNAVPQYLRGDGALNTGIRPWVYITADFAQWHW